MTTKKTFEIVAREILLARMASIKEKDRLEYLASKLALQFHLDNPNFDRARFLKACGLKP